MRPSSTGVAIDMRGVRLDTGIGLAEDLPFHTHHPIGNLEATPLDTVTCRPGPSVYHSRLASETGVVWQQQARYRSLTKIVGRSPRPAGRGRSCSAWGRETRTYS
jgi:hypothetical protein